MRQILQQTYTTYQHDLLKALNFNDQVLLNNRRKKNSYETLVLGWMHSCYVQQMSIDKAIQYIYTKRHIAYFRHIQTKKLYQGTLLTNTLTKQTTHIS